MSGLEIAGIVLGGIPLLISGLEHYAEGATTIKRMFTAPREFRSLSRRLRVEQDIFRNAMELLLADCVEDGALQDLLENVGGKTWADPEIDAALRRKLQKSHGLYMETIRDMDQTVSDFRARLHLSDDGKGPFNDSNSFREAWKRFHFGIKKADYMDLLDEFSKDNTALQKLTQLSLTLEPARLTRRRIPDFNKVRKHASSIFSTLQSGLHGSCPVSHRASLYMSNLAASAQREEQSFRIVLHHDIKIAAPIPPHWAIEETEVRTLESSSPTNAAPVAMRTPGTSSKGKRAVRWQDLSHAGSGTTMTASAAPLQAVDEIKDICESIQRFRMSKCGICLGYLQGQTDPHRHGLYWPEVPLVDKTALASISLGSLLAKTDPKAPSRLSVADSRRLALALSSGVLQLHDTPWLTNRWDHGDIILFVQGSTLLARHPFVSTDFQKVHESSSWKCSPAVRNETLFALGMVLIELCMQQNFDALLRKDEINADGTKHDLSDFLAANRLVDEVYDRAGKRYGDAVRRCVLCEFDQRKSSLEDDAFRRAVYENVVAVLEEDVAQFFGLGV